MSRTLGNGENCSLYYDKWIPGKDALITQVDPDQLPSTMKQWRVSDIIENGDGLLKINCFNQFGGLSRAKNYQVLEYKIRGDGMQMVHGSSLLPKLGTRLGLQNQITILLM